MKASNLYPAIKFTVPASELTRPAILLPESVKRITSPVICLAGDVILLAEGAVILTGGVILIAVPVENMPEGVMGMTDHEDSFTGAERIFAVYVERITGHDPLLTCSVNFLTDHV